MARQPGQQTLREADGLGQRGTRTTSREEVHSIFQNNKGLFSARHARLRGEEDRAGARVGRQEMGRRWSRRRVPASTPTGSRCASRRTSSKLRDDHATEDVKRIEKPSRATRFATTRWATSTRFSRTSRAASAKPKFPPPKGAVELPHRAARRFHRPAPRRPGAGRLYTDASNSFRQLSALRRWPTRWLSAVGATSLAMRDMFFGGVLGHLGVIPGLAALPGVV